MKMTELNYCSEDVPKINGILKEFKPHNSAIYSLAVTPDKKYVITGSLDCTIKIWELETGNSFQTLEGHEKEVTAVYISSDGGRLATCSEDHTIKLWKLETGNLIRNFTGHQSAVLGVLFSPDNKYIISISEDKTARVWDWNSKRIIRKLKDLNINSNSIAITPDGDYIAIGIGKTIKIWQWGSNEATLSLKGHKFTVSSLAIGPKGKYLVSGSLDKTIKIWDIKGGNLIKTLEGHEGGINSVAISYDREYIASGSGDKSLIVWGFNNDKKYGPFMHNTYVQSVAFIPNTHLVVAGDYNGIVRIWDFLEKCIDFESGLHPKETVVEISDELGKKITIFISYATADSERFGIQTVANLLKNSFVDVKDVLFWEEYMDDDIYVYMNDNLGKADVILVFCSENANKSDAVKSEWMAAHKMKKKLIPIFEDENDIPPLLTTKLGIQFLPNDIKGFVQELHELIDKKTRKIEI